MDDYIVLAFKAVSVEICTYVFVKTFPFTAIMTEGFKIKSYVVKKTF